MRRALLVAVAALGVAAVGAAVAVAAESGEVTVCIDETIEVTFVPDDTGQAVIDHGGYWTDADGNFYLDSGAYEGNPDDLSFVSVTVGPCAVVTSTTAPAPPSPPSPPRLFLCYSAWQTVPGVWDSADSQRLMRDGYWQPYAVAGPMSGGVNTMDGKYHLDCNPDEKGMKATGSYVDNNGYAIPEAYEGVYDSLPGVYEVYA